MRALPIYRYSPESLIDEIEIVTNPQGGSRAYLHARTDAAAEQITALKAGIENRGWTGLPFNREGKATLEIRGFDKPEQLLQYAQQQGFASGAVSTQAAPGDKHGFWDKFRHNTLKWTGVAYILGDVAFMTYATMEHGKNKKDLREAEGELAALMKKFNHMPPVAEKKRLDTAILGAKDAASGGPYKKLSGLGYAIGSVILTGFGSKDQSTLEIKKSSQKIDAFLKNEGLAHGQKGDLLNQEHEKKNPNLLDRAQSILRRYPSEALNLVYTGVGLLLMQSSFKAMNAPQKGYETLKDMTKRKRLEGLDIGLGLVTATSAIAGLTIKEKKKVEGEEKRHGIAGVWDWIQEKPLRATGYGYMVATLIHGIVTASKWKRHPVTSADHHNNQVMLGRAVFVGLNLLAEALMVISSKGHGEGVKSPDVDDSIIASTAEYVAKQNPAIREQLVDRLAGHMASPDILGGKSDEIAAKLRAQMAGMTSNPWAKTSVSPAPVVNAETPSSKVHAVQAERMQETQNLQSAL